MGLDMYLIEKHDVSNYTRSENKKLKINGKTFYPIDEETITYIACIVGRWRKANAIHGWFIRELAGGVDDCKEIRVSKEKLLELRELCVRAKDNLDLAPTLLPTQKGYFFGSYGYDKQYIEDLKHTIGIIDNINDNGDFYYQASW